MRAAPGRPTRRTTAFEPPPGENGSTAEEFRQSGRKDTGARATHRLGQPTLTSKAREHEKRSHAPQTRSLKGNPAATSQGATRYEPAGQAEQSASARAEALLRGAPGSGRGGGAHASGS